MTASSSSLRTSTETSFRATIPPNCKSRLRADSTTSPSPVRRDALMSSASWFVFLYSSCCLLPVSRIRPIRAHQSHTGARIQTDGRRVEIGILNDVLGQAGELGPIPHAVREQDQVIDNVLRDLGRHARRHSGLEQTRGDGYDPNAKRRQISRN